MKKTIVEDILETYIDVKTKEAQAETTQAKAEASKLQSNLARTKQEIMFLIEALGLAGSDEARAFNMARVEDEEFYTSMRHAMRVIRSRVAKPKLEG